MSLPAVLLPPAQAEFDEAVGWYARRSIHVAVRFIDCVEEVLGQIRALPELHATVYRDVRCALVRHFPYAVYYRVDRGRVLVIAVFHARRDPEVWQSRV